MAGFVRRSVAFSPGNIFSVAKRLRRAPGFLLLSVLALGVGIGLSTATFAYVEANLNPRLPYADATQLRFVRLEIASWQHAPPQRDLTAVLRALPFVEGVTELNYETRKELRGNGLGGRPDVSRFAANFFDVMGLRPQVGRWPRSDEARTGGAAVVSANLWSRGFFNRREIGDAHVIVDGVTVPIVGVLPGGVMLGTDVWIPYPSETFLDTVQATYSSPIIRLRKGVPRAAIDGQLAAAGLRLKAISDARPGGRPYLLSLNSFGFAGQRAGEREITLIGLAIGILLIAASNVATRWRWPAAYARLCHDFAAAGTRWARPARRDHARELFTEVGVISALGGCVGGAVSSAAIIGVLTRMTPAELLADGAAWGVRLPVFSPNLFIYVLVGLVVSVVIAGGVPARRASNVDPADPLKDGAGTTTGRAKSEFRFLLVGELAIAMALITVTSLLLLSARNLATFDFGFDFRMPVEARVSFVLPDDKQQTADRYYASTLARVRATPGVAMASTFMPAGFNARKIISRPTLGAEHSLEPDGSVFDAGPDAFRTLGVRMLEGRDFTDGDRASGGAAILTERASRVLFPKKNAIGSTIKIGGDKSQNPWMRVIGVVRDVRLGTTGRGDPEVFVSTSDVMTHGNLVIVARPTGTDPQFMATLERSLTAALPPNSSIYIHKMAESFELQVEVTKFFTRTLTFIGVCALLLAMVGLFSVLSFTVGRRMREFGVRVTLGATPRQVLIVVMKDGLEVALAGTAIGALLSFWASTGISRMLFGMTITDPVALIVAEAALLVAAVGASLMPGVRASKVDPMEALRVN